MLARVAKHEHPRASIDWATAEVQGGDLTVELTGEPNAEWAKRAQAVVERLVRAGSAWGAVEDQQDGRHGRGGHRRRGGGPAPPPRRRRPAGQCGLRAGGRGRRRRRALRGGQRDDRGLPSRSRTSRPRTTGRTDALRRRRRGPAAPAPGAAARAPRRRARGPGSGSASPRAARGSRAASPARRGSARRTSAARPAGRGGATTRPASSRSRTVCAIDCGRMRSAAARSLMLAGPSRSRRPSTASCANGRAGLDAQAADEPPDGLAQLVRELRGRGLGALHERRVYRRSTGNLYR